MSYSVSQRNEDTKALSLNVPHLNQESLFPAPPAYTAAPRWLSLAPYKEAKSFFQYWDEEAMGSVLAAPAYWPTEESAPSLCNSLSRLTTTAGSETEDEISPLEGLKNRILAVLRCYLYNLGVETLVTGEMVDEGVAAAL